MSLGIFVLLIPFIFAWAWLKTPFDLTIEKSKIQKLTPLAQQIINDRQSIIGAFTDIFPYMFIILIVVGCSIIWVGISSWNRRQKLLDDHQIPDSPPPTIDSYIAVESLVNDNVNRLFSDKF